MYTRHAPRSWLVSATTRPHGDYQMSPNSPLVWVLETTSRMQMSFTTLRLYNQRVSSLTPRYLQTKDER